MKTLIIDVREPDEFMSIHVENAINIPHQRITQGLPSELRDTPLDTPLVLYCASGGRAEVSIQYLRSYGFTDLTNGINKDHVNSKYL